MRKTLKHYEEFSKTFESNGQGVIIINKGDVEDLFLDLIDEFGAYPPSDHYDDTIATYSDETIATSAETSAIVQRGILVYPDIMFDKGKRKIYGIGGDVKIRHMEDITDNSWNTEYGTKATLIGYQDLKWTKPSTKLEGKFDTNQKEYPLFSFIIDFVKKPDRERANKKVTKLVNMIPQINVIDHYFYPVINWDVITRTLEEKYFISYRLEIVFILDEIDLPQRKRINNAIREEIKYFVAHSRMLLDD